MENQVFLASADMTASLSELAVDLLDASSARQDHLDCQEWMDLWDHQDQWERRDKVHRAAVRDHQDLLDRWETLEHLECREILDLRDNPAHPEYAALDCPAQLDHLDQWDHLDPQEWTALAVDQHFLDLPVQWVHQETPEDLDQMECPEALAWVERPVETRRTVRAHLVQVLDEQSWSGCLVTGLVLRPKPGGPGTDASWTSTSKQRDNSFHIRSWGNICERNKVSSIH